MKKKLLMITWRDIHSIFAGGAEVLTHGLLKKLTKDYDITVLTSAFPNCKTTEIIDGIRYIRLGSKKHNYIGKYNWRVYLSVLKYWYKNIRNKTHYDVVIEQINNVPFFYFLYGSKNTIIFINQLTRENWFVQLPKTIAWIGFLFLEPFYLTLMRLLKLNIITISNSTKNRLMEWKMLERNIHIITMGINLKPLEKVQPKARFKDFTVLSFGDVRPMKQTHHQLKAFEIAKKSIPNLKLIIVGKLNGLYGVRILDHIDRSIYRNDIFYYSFVSEQKKAALMKRSHVILQTSTREGWGLTVTEANSKGTPAIVYNTDGLRDSVKNNITGLVCAKNTPSSLAANIVKIHDDKKVYKQLSVNSLAMSKEMTFDNTALDFKRAVRKIEYKNVKQSLLPKLKFAFPTL